MIADLIGAFDRRGLALADSLRSPWLDTAFHALTWLGSLWLLVPLAVGLSLRHRERAFSPFAWFGPMALAATCLVVYPLKELVSRPRPDVYQALVPIPLDASFPSAHAAQAAALAIALGWRAAWPVRAALGVAVIAVAGSRPYLQVHYPSDVLAGVAIGTTCALLVRRLLQERER